MIFYFLKEGPAEIGPLTLDQLKRRPVTSDTPVWFAGLEEWTAADEIHELKELFITNPSRSWFSKSKLGKILNRLFRKKSRKKYQVLLSKENKNLN